MGAPNEKEIEILQKFRDTLKVKDIMIELNERQKSDIALLAWLRESDLNIQKATEMLRKHLIWIKENDIHNILNWEPPTIYHEMYPYDIYPGKCMDGTTVLSIPFGKWDTRKALDAGERDAWTRYCVQMFSIAIEENHKINESKRGPPVSQLLLILDVHGFAFRQISSVSAIQTYLDLAGQILANFPDIIKAALFVDTPRAFSTLFAILKPLIPGRTLARFELYSKADRQKIKPSLLKHISSTQLSDVYCS